MAKSTSGAKRKWFEKLLKKHPPTTPDQVEALRLRVIMEVFSVCYRYAPDQLFDEERQRGIAADLGIPYPMLALDALRGHRDPGWTPDDIEGLLSNKEAWAVTRERWA